MERQIVTTLITPIYLNGPAIRAKKGKYMELLEYRMGGFDIVVKNIYSVSGASSSLETVAYDRRDGERGPVQLE